jgi:hypothetical protein
MTSLSAAVYGPVRVDGTTGTVEVLIHADR